MWTLAFDGDANSPEFLKIERDFDLEFCPTQGFGSPDPESVSVTNWDGHLNGMDYNHLVVVHVWQE